MNRTRLILASASPRRRELLCENGYAFEVIPANVSEPDQWDSKMSPVEIAESTSRFKAANVGDRVKEGIVLAADTLAALQGVIFGKPQDREDARRILSTLAGTTHEVITGITVLDVATGKCLINHDTTRVTMKSLSYDELEAYLDTKAWKGKAGAYGIQDHGDAFVTKLEGSFSNVVGLPIDLVRAMLAEFAVMPEPTTPPSG